MKQQLGNRPILAVRQLSGKKEESSVSRWRFGESIRPRLDKETTTYRCQQVDAKSDDPLCYKPSDKQDETRISEEIGFL